MSNSKSLPITLFGVAVAIVVASSVFRYWSANLQYEIDVQVAALRAEQDRAAQEVEEIAASRPKPEIVMTSKKVGRYPQTVCRGLSCKVKWQDIITKVPEHRAPVRDAELEAKLEKAVARANAIAIQLAELSEQKKRIDSVAGVDRDTIRMAVSLIVLLTSVYVILNGKYKAESEKWAFGSVGTIVGYWLG